MTCNLSLAPGARDILAELHVETLRSTEELRCGQQLGTEAGSCREALKKVGRCFRRLTDFSSPLAPL